MLSFFIISTMPLALSRRLQFSHKDNTLYKLAIFDLDGTILDTIQDIHSALQSTLARTGFPNFCIHSTKRYVGNGMKKLVERSVGMDKFKPEYEALFREIYAERMMDKTVIFDKFHDVLDFCRQNIQHLYIISNKATYNTDELVRHYGLNEYFHGWYGADSFKEKKPSPMPINEIMKKTGALPEETIMIGDSYTDIDCGVAAGVKTCFCTYGYGKLGEHDADFTVNNPTEIIDILKVTDEVRILR